jgi:hypothetical protein
MLNPKEALMTGVSTSLPTVVSCSSELVQIQQHPTSPFGMLFLMAPHVHVHTFPLREDDDKTRTCEETSYDGKSKLDCVDD